MLKLCENGSNIDYLYETGLVLRNATETEISGLTFWLQFKFLKPNIPSIQEYLKVTLRRISGNPAQQW